MASLTRSKCPFAYSQASPLHILSSRKQILSFAVIVNVLSLIPESLNMPKVFSATPLVIFFAVRYISLAELFIVKDFIAGKIVEIVFPVPVGASM